ncbi:Transcriptional regulator, Xre family [hydrothermal vent metagenome]|uniref:Transcriptional regulator, Xre family n=1 Tax=hydrothermal vent metagenome TaxID=652676 RepID=A0A3B0RMU2_9ZZZZ
MTPFGKKIRLLRKNRDISQKQMAADLELSPAYLSALEHGHRGQPTWALVQQVISYFNLIWDDAEEIEELARLSHPRITVDSAGLPPETVAMVNQMARKIQNLSPVQVAAIAKILDKQEP